MHTIMCETLSPSLRNRMKVMMPSSSTPDTEKTMTALLRLQVPGVFRSPCVNLCLVVWGLSRVAVARIGGGALFPGGRENRVHPGAPVGFPPARARVFSQNGPLPRPHHPG